MPCTAILFDLDDTLIPFTAIDHRATVTASEFAASLDPALADTANTAIKFQQFLKKQPFAPEGSSLSEDEHRISLWAQTMNITDKAITLPTEVHNRWREERLRLFKFSEDVTNLLKNLTASGYKMAIITNGPKDVQRPKLSGCDAAAFFGENIVVSGEQPQWKPHASIFKTALAMLGVEPGEAIMVGDSLCADIQGGINANLLGTVWIQGGNAAPEGLPQPTCSIANVVDLESVLPQFA